MGFYNNAQSSVQSAIADIPQVMRRVYLWMTFGLLVTAGTAFVAASSGLGLLVIRNPFLWLIALFVELGLVMYISARISRIAPGTAQVLFLIYAAVNGIVLSMIFYAYNLPTIMYAAIAAGAMFGVTSIISYTTKVDLSRFGGILMMGVFGLLIASVINIFVGGDQLFWIINYAGVLIFVGLTAWDTQRIKRMALNPTFNMSNDQGVMEGRLAIWGALSLYLDMINLFLFLLRIMGGRGGRR